MKTVQTIKPFLKRLEEKASTWYPENMSKTFKKHCLHSSSNVFTTQKQNHWPICMISKLMNQLRSYHFLSKKILPQTSLANQQSLKLPNKQLNAKQTLKHLRTTKKASKKEDSQTQHLQKLFLRKTHRTKKAFIRRKQRKTCRLFQSAASSKHAATLLQWPR